MTPRQQEDVRPVRPKSSRDILALVIRSALSAALIGGLAYHIGSGKILAQIELIPWHILIIVVLVLTSHVLAVTPRWAVILSALGHPLGWSALVGSVFLGFLFNQVLPTAVGGDIVRAVRARQFGVPLEVAIHSVLLDRASGVFVLLLATMILLPFSEPLMSRGALLWIVGILAAGGLVAGLGLWALGRLPLLEIPVVGGLQRIVISFGGSIAALIKQPRAVVAVLVAAAVGQLIPVVAIALLAAGLHVNISPIDVTVVTFGAMLAATIPISLAGWGIREGALVFLFGAYGVPAQTAFAISVLFGASLMLASIPGALVLLGEWASPAPKRHRASD